MYSGGLSPGGQNTGDSIYYCDDGSVWKIDPNPWAPAQAGEPKGIKTGNQIYDKGE